MKIETNIIFLDTNIFEKENFFRGHKLIRLGELSKNENIEVKLTNITYLEILNRINKNLQNAKAAMKTADRLLEDKAKILKNWNNYKIWD